ncbi:cell division protein FtsA [Candidatus Dependentiae bacterium]|nr:cell division protein FtsA [Candidatus Dependentiae bacterium]
MIDDYKAIIDIGTSKIVVIVGEYNSQTKELNILGFGRSKSEGLKNGVVVEIDKTSNAIAKAVEEAETMSGREIRNVTIGVSGNRINCFEKVGVTAVARPDKEISAVDINRAVDLAKAFKMNGDFEILNILPKEFIVDGEGGIKDPTNMSGWRLEVKALVVTVETSVFHNLMKSVNDISLNIDNYAINSFAGSYSVLNEEEKNLGALLIDIGAGTTDIAAFENGSISTISSFDTGGDIITLNISKNFTVSFNEAERIKIKYGSAIIEHCDPDEEIEIQLVGSMQLQKIKRIELVKVINKSIVSLFEKLKNDIEKKSPDVFDNCICGIVLTGGVAETRGILDLCEKILELPARAGIPSNITGVSDYVKKAEYAVSVGLLNYAIEHENSVQITPSNNFYTGIIKKCRDMAGQIFNF